MWKSHTPINDKKYTQIKIKFYLYTKMSIIFRKQGKPELLGREGKAAAKAPPALTNRGTGAKIVP